MKIEIITTNSDSSKETGFGSLQTCDSILNSINLLAYEASIRVCQTKEDLQEVVKRAPNLVLLAVKYIISPEGEIIWLSEFFEANNINFSGSSREALRFDSDKVLAKAFLKDKSISTARYFTTIPGQHQRDYDLPIGYPLFVKPSDAANANGIDDLSLVTNFAEFQSKVSSLYELYELPILVEEYLNGQEFTVAMIKTKSGDLLVSSLEIIQAKSTNTLRAMGEKISLNQSQELKVIDDLIMMDKVKTLAIDVFIDLGVRDFARVDIKSNKNGECFFIEANLVPGMTKDSSYFPKAFEMDLGLSYDNIIEFIVDEGISRVSKVS